MNRCYELIKKVLLTNEQNVAKQKDIMVEFQDDLDIIEKTIQNFTMNYHQSMSMLESKHIQNNQQLDYKLDQIKKQYLEQRYQIQGGNHQQKKAHEQRVYEDLASTNQIIQRESKENFDNEIFKLTLQKNNIFNNLEKKISHFFMTKDKEIDQIKSDIEILNRKKDKDISAIILLKEKVGLADAKILQGIELEEAKERRREYRKRKVEEIDMIFNITKHYEDKIIEKKSIISRITIEKKMMSIIWKKEVEIEVTTLEQLIKEVENKKREFIEQSEIEHQYLEMKERDSILFEVEETIETLKESQIGESFDLALTQYNRQHDRNNEITSGSQIQHEFQLESNQSMNVFIETLINSTHSIMREMYSFEIKRLDMQMELLVDLLNQQFVNLNTFITREVEILKEDLNKNQSYLDYESKQFEDMYVKSLTSLIRDSSSLIQILKKQVEHITLQMKQLYRTISNEVDLSKQKHLTIKIRFNREMNETKHKHQRMIQLYRRNYVYKIEQQFALQKALKFKLEAKPIENKVDIHQKKERLFDRQKEAMTVELSRTRSKTIELSKQIQIAQQNEINKLNAELSKEHKILQDLLDGNDQMVVRQKNLLKIQLESKKRQEVSKI